MPRLSAQTITIRMIFPCAVSREAAEEEVRRAAAHSRLHMPHVSVLREPERGADVAHGQVAEENTEGREQALAVRQRHVLVALVAREQEARMKRDAGQVLVAQGLLVSFDLVGDGVRLLRAARGPKDSACRAGYRIPTRRQDGSDPSTEAPVGMKRAEEKGPGTWRPSSSDRQFLYTTDGRRCRGDTARTPRTSRARRPRPRAWRPC